MPNRLSRPRPLNRRFTPSGQHRRMPAAKMFVGFLLRAAAMAALAGSWHQPDDGPRRRRVRLPPPLNPSDDPYTAGIAVTKRLWEIRAERRQVARHLKEE
jgi:hypothetical protein